MLRIAPPLLALTLVGSTACSHEFWLQPLDYSLAPGDRLVANGYVGQTLEGDVLGYFPEATVAFDLTRGESTLPVRSEPGQIPAVDMPLLGEGLHVLRFQSANYELSYEEYDAFVKFVDEWRQHWALDVHRANGFPQTDIREVYFRYAKALVKVGAGEGSDVALGMPLELVARTNPYTAPADAAVVVELQFLGEALSGGAVKAFHRAPDGTVTVAPLETGPDGTIVVPRAPGLTLINAVVLDTASPRMQEILGASWQSLWASLTYEID